MHVRLGLVGGALEIHRGRKQALIIREISRKPAHLIFIRQGVVLIKHWLLLLLLLLLLLFAALPPPPLQSACDKDGHVPEQPDEKVRVAIWFLVLQQ